VSNVSNAPPTNPGPITLLVIGDPAAGYLKPLAALPPETRIIVSRDRARLREAAPEADVILNGDFLDPTLLTETFPHATRVRWVHALMAGVDKTLSPEIVASDVPMTNGRGLFRRALAEWTVGAMVYFAYEFRRLVRNQEAGRWESFDHPTLYGRTLGIVGYGSIGQAIAERAHAFRMRIVIARRSTSPAADPLVDQAYTPDQLNAMLSECDYVAVTAPLTAKTRGMIGAAQIAAMKPSAVLINVGRGAVIDEAALIAALEAGPEGIKSAKLRGAALDVFTTEPLPAGHPFYAMENVLLSPHTADRSPESRSGAVQFFIENFERFRKGEPLENVVDKHAGY
jgi:phosphoglycerate dehydrogenase-like enzyme